MATIKNVSGESLFIASIGRTIAPNASVTVADLIYRNDIDLNRFVDAYPSALTDAPTIADAVDSEYDNSSSSLTATDVQGAIDEIAATAASATSAITALQGKTLDALYTAIAASAALTATTTPTLFDKNYTFAANRMTEGKVYTVEFCGKVTAANGSDTLALALLLGSTTLMSKPAFDITANDYFAGRFSFVIRTVGASGTMVGFGELNIGVSGTMNPVIYTLDSTTIDTTATQQLALRGTLSSNNAGNSCRLDIFNVVEIDNN